MTPLAPLRILLTGLFGLLILGAGVYCLYRFAEHGQHSPASVAVRDRQAADKPLEIRREGSDLEEAQREVEVFRVNTDVRASVDSVPPWVWLTAGLLLTLVSVGGRWPLMWVARLLSANTGDAPSAMRQQGMQIERADGTRLNVEIHGNTNGQTIVFTHGWSLDSTAWYYAKKLLGERFRLVLWDLPGLGRSRGPSDRNFEIAKMAGDLGAVVDSVSGNGKVYLVGHSIGGMVSQIYGGSSVAENRARICGIVLVHTTYTNPLRTMLGAPLWSAIEKVVIVPAQYAMIALAPLAWLSNWQSYLNGSMQLTTRLTSFAGSQSFQQVDYAAWLSTKAWPAVVARGNLAMFRYDSQTALRDIDVPMLVIAGEHDRVTKPTASDRIVELTVGSRIVRNSGGHLALFEFHHQVMQDISDFIVQTEANRFAGAPHGNSKSIQTKPAIVE